MSEKKINRRDALKRIGKIALAASVASIAPVDMLAKESLPKKERGYSHGKNHDCPDCDAAALQRL